MAIGDLYQLTVSIGCAGVHTQINLGYQMDAGTIDADTLEATCQAFLTNAVPPLLLCMSGGASVNQIAMFPVTDVDEVPGFLSLDGEDGALAGEALPASMAALITMPTNAPNAKHNGRIYLPGMPEDTQEQGTFLAAQVLLMQDFADELAIDLQPTAPQTAEFTAVVISREVDGAPRVPPVGFGVLIPLVRTSVRQQRKRLTRKLGLRS